MTQARRPAGVPTGGQFAPMNRPPASGIDLVDDDLVEASDAPVAVQPPGQSVQERLASLEPLCRYGASYNRGVASAISDHRHFAELGETDAAEHYLLIAEFRADYIEWEDFVENDPFERAARERRATEAAQADGSVEPAGHVDPAGHVEPVAAAPAAQTKSSGSEIVARIFPGGEPNRGVRRHKLLTAELAEKIPGLYDSEGTPVAEKMLYAHYFTGSADWYIAELDRETGEMFGRCDLGLGFPEWGYVTIQQLAELRGQFGLPVERDIDFKPRTARELGLAP